MSQYFTQRMLLVSDFNSVTRVCDRLSGNVDPTSSDSAFCDQVKLILDNFDQQHPQDSWEAIKGKIEDISQKATCFRQTQSKLELKALLTSLKSINQRIFQGVSLDDCVLIEACIASLLENCCVSEEQDCEWDWVIIEGSIHPSFLHLEDEIITQFLNKLEINGSISDDLSSILQVLHLFYADLYDCADVVTDEEIDTFLNGLQSLPKVNRDLSYFSFSISEKEIKDAIKQLQSGKSPDSDGLTAAFYKHFSDQVAPILCQVFKAALKNKSISLSIFGNHHLAVLERRSISAHELSSYFSHEY